MGPFRMSRIPNWSTGAFGSLSGMAGTLTQAERGARAPVAPVHERLLGLLALEVRDGLLDLLGHHVAVSALDAHDEPVRLGGVAHVASTFSFARTAASFASSSFRSATERSALRGRAATISW